MTDLTNRVVVLDDPDLPRHAWSDDFGRWLDSCGWQVERVGADDLPTALEAADTFTTLHGGVYPVDAEDAIVAFCGRGGSLLHVGELPFEQAVRRAGTGWETVVRTLGDIRGGTGHGPLGQPIDAFRARLGLITYSIPHRPDDAAQRFDPELVGAVDVEATPGRGLDLSFSVPIHAVHPELRLFDHRAYQARPQVRSALRAGELVGADGSAIASTLLFVKSWGNPYDPASTAPNRRWALLTAAPAGDLPGEVLQAMKRWLCAPVCLLPMETPTPSIRAGEVARVEPRLSGELPSGWSLRYEVAALTRDDLRRGARDWQRAETVDAVQVAYRDDVLVQAVRVSMLDDTGQVRDREELGIACASPAALAAGPRIHGDGRYFSIEREGTRRRSTWLSGTNWQDRDGFAFTWDRPDLLRVAVDAAQMERAGIEIARPHYFHPGWFRAVPAGVYGAENPAYADRFDDGPLLSDRHLRALEAHVVVFSAFGIALNPTMYTNVPPEMGNPSHWMGTSRLFQIEALIDEQERFGRQIIEHFGEMPGLVWDLDNEPDTAMDTAGAWLHRHARVWAATGHSVGVGALSIRDSIQLGEHADWHSVHGSLRHGADVFISGKPAVLQEAHNPAPATPEGDREQSRHLSRAYAWTVRHGGAGVMPWNWNMSHMNWRSGGGWVDYWDLELGTAVHADGTARRAQSTMRNWAALLHGLEFDATDDSVGFVYPSRFVAGRGSAEYLEVAARTGLRVRALDDRDSPSWDLDGLRIVVLPHSAIGFSRASLTRLRAFVEAGGILWAHNDTLALDETGRPGAAPFDIPPTSCVTSLGHGVIHWTMGWNFDDHPADRALPLDLVPLLDLMTGLPAPDTLSRRLADGMVRFTEHLARGERSMMSDWASDEPIPDQQIVDSIVIERAGHPVRGWSDGRMIDLDSTTLAAESELFVLDVSATSILLATEGELRVTGAASLVALVVAPDVRALRDREQTPAVLGRLPVSATAAGMVVSVPDWAAGQWIRLELE